jgi:hypothetical protein
VSVYAVLAVGTDFVKIGHSAGSAAGRVRELSTASPHELQILHEYATGTADMERGLHLMFHVYQVRGEWFRQDAMMEQLLTNTFARMKEDRRFGVLLACYYHLEKSSRSGADALKEEIYRFLRGGAAGA